MSSASILSQGSGAVTPDPKPKRRRRRAAGLVAIALVVAAGVALTAGVFDGHPAQTQGVSDNSDPISITTVTEGALSSQIGANGTLEYTTAAGSDGSIVNQTSGTFSELPFDGEVISRGQVLYRVSNEPVILLYGNTPVYRSLSEGDKGPDVWELNHNLVALGYATSSEVDWDWSYFGTDTAYALERLQDKLGEDETGSLREGQAVFLPGAIRISSVSATLGTSAAPGAVIMQGTSTTRQVIVDLNAAEQSEVSVGDSVQITLPDGQATPGVVRGIGTVASGSGANSTLPVYITLKHPQAAGTLEDAQVTVEITTASAKRALIVPIDALLALSGGGYAVETVNARGVHQLVAVSLGTFDDASGNVQVTGDLQPGERIVAPNI